MTTCDHKPYPGPWVCFHCEQICVTPREAKEHFGIDDWSTPACLIKGAEGGLVQAIRQQERDISRLQNDIHTESTEAHRSYFAQQIRHQAQLTAIDETAYSRGVHDACSMPEEERAKIIRNPRP